MYVVREARVDIKSNITQSVDKQKLSRGSSGPSPHSCWFLLIHKTHEQEQIAERSIDIKAN